MPTMLEWFRGLNALRVLAQVSAAEQIVGRERNQRACHRQLALSTVVSRRVNSTVRRLRFSEEVRNDMRIVFAFSLILFISYALGAQSVAPVSTDKRLDNEEYAVYTALISALIEQERSRVPIELVVIDDHTTKIAEPNYLSGIGSPEAYDSYQAKNEQSFPLENLFDLKVKYLLVDEKESTRLDSRVFAQKYPHSLGSFLFSRAGFNHDKTEALVYVEKRCGFDCAQASGYQLVKETGGWKIKQTRFLWIA